MEEKTAEQKSPSLPLSALRLLVPPITLISAAMWQTVEQKNVADYGMLEEFVSMVTDIVPELLPAPQRAQLALGLRARLVLGLCQFEADSALVQPHLDRVQHLIQEWVKESGAESTETPDFGFVDLVQNLLKNPEERENFFQKVFPEDFGPQYDGTLHTLMWTFLSRLEEFFPTQTFQQVSSMFVEVSSVLEDCVTSVSGSEELKALLQHQKQLSQLEHNDGSLDSSCIISALKLPSQERPQTQQQADVCVLSCTSDLERESITLLVKADINSEEQTCEMEDCESDWTLQENETVELCKDTTEHQEENVEPQTREEGRSVSVKQCHVQLQRLDALPSAQARPVRANRGLKMKKILQEEKKDLREKVTAEAKSAPRKASKRGVSETSAKKKSSRSHTVPISDEDSWSFYSDNGSVRSLSEAGSWSNYSDEGSDVEPPDGAASDDSIFDIGSNEDSSFKGAKNTSGDKPSTPKKKVECIICKVQVDKGLRAHMKTHFPTGDFACPRCDSRFRLLTSLKQHLKRTCFEFEQQQVDPGRPDNASNLFKCETCEEAFKYKVSLQKHKLTHHELYCNVCRRVMKDAVALARHKVSHTLFQCNRCEETFTLFKPLLRHCQNVHKISRPFRCYQCPKTYGRLRILIAHEWKHTGHLPFQCNQCGLRVKTDGDLVSHQRVHTKEKPYLCAECGKTFSQRSNLLRHLNLLHGESQNIKKHSCSECGKTFKEKCALKKHQRSKHFEALTQLFRHPCQYCGKMMASSTIARHKLIHTGERPFKCTVSECDKSFRSTSEVKRHVLIHHTTERPFKCDDCGKGFVKRCYLAAHAKTHSGEKPFVCNSCGKAFPKLYSLQRHKRLVHIAETK